MRLFGLGLEMLDDIPKVLMFLGIDFPNGVEDVAFFIICFRANIYDCRIFTVNQHGGLLNTNHFAAGFQIAQNEQHRQDDPGR